MKGSAALPVASLLRRVLAGDLESTTCALCLCDESLLPSALPLPLDSGKTITLAELIKELNYNMVSEDASTKKACTSCADKLFNFYIFMENCQQRRQTLQKLVNILDRETSLLENPLSDLNYSYSGFSITVSIALHELVEYIPNSSAFPKCDLEIYSENISKHQEENFATFDAPSSNQLNKIPDQCKEIKVDTENYVNKEKNENELRPCLTDFAPMFNEHIKCQKSFSDFTSMEDVTQHQKVHGRLPHHHCRICDYTVSRLLGLVAHFKSFHPDETSPQHVNIPQIFDCRQCNKTLKNKKNLVQHVLLNHSSKEIVLNKPPRRVKSMLQSSQKFTCESCAKEFIHRGKLVRHFTKNQCNFAKLTECITCNTKFARKHCCPYKCSECSRSPCRHHKYLQKYMKVEKEVPFSKHICLDCEFVYTKKEDLIDHVNKKHLCISPHLCSECGMRLSSENALSIHMTRSHPQVQKYCPYCNTVISKYLLPQHITECMITKKNLSCELCYMRFETEEMAVSHAKSHVTALFQCDKCDLKCPSRNELKLHLVQCSSGEKNYGLSEKTPVIFPCHKCKLDFATKDEILAHEVSHSIDTGYLCRGCNSIYPTKVKRFECMRTHSLEAKAVCPICGRQFQNHRLPLHMKVHIERGEMESPPSKRKKALSKSHMCDICGSLFTSLLNMKNHRDRHNEQEKCPYCSKLVWKRRFRKHIALHESTSKRLRKKLSCIQCTFSTRYEFVYEGHINRVHRQIKPYTCEVCAKTFHSKVNLNNHKYSHNKTIHQCEECRQTFRSAKGYQLHMKKHRGDFSYPCEYCDMRFVSASRRNEHRDRVHLGPQFACAVCDVKFYRQSKRHQHMRSVHD